MGVTTPKNTMPMTTRAVTKPMGRLAETDGRAFFAWTAPPGRRRRARRRERRRPRWRDRRPRYRECSSGRLRVLDDAPDERGHRIPRSAVYQWRSTAQANVGEGADRTQSHAGRALALGIIAAYVRINDARAPLLERGEEMIEHEAEGSVTAPHRRGEGIVQVCFIPPQHDVALQLRDMRTLRRRPAGVDGTARRIQREKAQIAAAQPLLDHPRCSTRVGNFQHQRNIGGRGMEHRRPRPGPGHFGPPVQPPPKKRHAAEFDPRRRQPVQATPQELRHTALIEARTDTIAHRTALGTAQETGPLLVREGAVGMGAIRTPG